MNLLHSAAAQRVAQQVPRNRLELVVVLQVDILRTGFKEPLMISVSTTAPYPNAKSNRFTLVKMNVLSV